MRVDRRLRGETGFARLRTSSRNTRTDTRSMAKDTDKAVSPSKKQVTTASPNEELSSPTKGGKTGKDAAGKDGKNAEEDDDLVSNTRTAYSEDTAVACEAIGMGYGHL